MNDDATRNHRPAGQWARWTLLVCMLPIGAAHALRIDTGIDDLDLSVVTDFRYAVGIRTESRDAAIGNGIFFDEGDYKFDQGDIVTNRLDIAPALNARYTFNSSWLNNIGFRFSGNLFDDFAYPDGDVEARPGSAPSELPAGLLGPNQQAIGTQGLSPRVPYSELTSYTGAHYTELTRDRNRYRAEIQDLFASVSLFIGDRPVNIKAGQLANFYGQALFNPFFGVAYSQGPVDLNKALTIPSIRATDLFIPLEQVTADIGLTRSLSFGFQYFLEWRRLRAPEGGTYLSPGDPFLDGPNRLFLGNLPVTGPFFVGREANESGNNHGAYSLKLKWDAARNLNLGFYYRKFDETVPWIHVTSATPQNQPNVFGGLQELVDTINTLPGIDTEALGVPTLPGNYRLVYPHDTELFGIAANTKLFGISFGGELVYNKDRALLSEILDREESGRKARGDVISGVVNGLYLIRNFQLFGIPLFDQGTVIVEVNGSYLDKVTERKDVYKEVGSGACRRDAALFGSPGINGSTKDGCASDYHIGGAVFFQPIWYQVFQGIDLNMTFFYQNQSFKNTSPINLVGAEGYVNGTVGFGAVYNQNLSASLNYNFFDTQFRTGTNVDGEKTITSFNGVGTVADRDYVSLTLQYSF